MFFAQIEIVLSDLAAGCEGDGYSCNILMKSGHVFADRVLRWVVNSGGSDVLLLDKDDRPPLYVSPADIEAIELCQSFNRQADADLDEANDGELCTACGRDGLDCSRDPCEAVIADRAA